MRIVQTVYENQIIYFKLFISDSRIPSKVHNVLTVSSNAGWLHGQFLQYLQKVKGRGMRKHIRSQFRRHRSLLQLFRSLLEICSTEILETENQISIEITLY